MSVCVCLALAEPSQDSLCVQKDCPAGQLCRVVMECPSPGMCSLKAECLVEAPHSWHLDLCIVGHPILEMRDGVLSNTLCNASLPCPGSGLAYCNDELWGVLGACCRSNPDSPVKPGQCLTDFSDHGFYCIDACNNDGDCRDTWKCCQYGCKRICRPPQVEYTCPSLCGENTYCLRPEMPRCWATGQCFSLGDCVACDPVCGLECPRGYVNDSRGCPICQCRPSVNNTENLFSKPQLFWLDYNRHHVVIISTFLF
ncbi:unnamed protein product [Candidula unifasciata]|uniref:WAP four-disulfide core domain 2 n=1 Tax=Candidula unifasciata TaxID=100452 RepID=A0A8S3ZWT2_9EUPU|nr:unnamed protein product [Candidula unifasciata]